VAIGHRRQVYAEGLGRLLEHGGLMISGAACDADALVQCLSETTPDVLVLDGCFESAAGTPARLRSLRSVAPAMRVLVLADAVDDRLRAAVRDGDVDGVVLTTCIGSELTSAVRQVAAGHAVVPAGWLGRADRRTTVSDPLADLSPRQREVLELVAQGLTNEEIGARLFLSAHTVKFHVREIYDRLGVRNRIKAAQTLHPPNG
jgi:DNA-binding NarL/FixJ family response regulator